jgi:Flp pilus assembly protein TadD
VSETAPAAAPAATSPADQATALAQSDDFEALAKLQKLTRQNPENASVEAALGRYLARHEDNAGSEEHLVQAIRLEPANLEYRLNLATLYDHTRRYAQALALYRRITRAAPDDVEDNPLPFDAIRARSHYLARMLEGE